MMKAQFLVLATSFFAVSGAFAGGGQDVSTSVLICSSPASNYRFYVSYTRGEAVGVSGQPLQAGSLPSFETGSENQFDIRNGKIRLDRIVGGGMASEKQVRLDLRIDGLNSKSSFGLSGDEVLSGQFSGQVEGVSIQGQLACNFHE